MIVNYISEKIVKGHPIAQVDQRGGIWGLGFILGHTVIDSDILLQTGRRLVAAGLDANRFLFSGNKECAGPMP